ncbi:MAG: NHL repeat-containing protein [Dehalococcoidia bacterium]|nr:NHL repeat-containing protein [Dehalococcoidia bacterium]
MTPPPYPQHRLRLGIAATAAFLGLLLWQTGCGSGNVAPGATPTGQSPGTTRIPQPTLPAQQQLPVSLVLGRQGSEPGSFNEPGGLTVDSQGNLYVADIMNHRIQKFDAEGNFLAQAGGKGSGEGQFNEPWGVAVDGDGNVYAADSFNHRIQKFDADLNFVLAFGKPASNLEDPEPDVFWGPRDLSVDADGNVWVADTGTGRVVKYGPDGSLIQPFGGMGSGPGQFKELTSIEIAPGGDIFVADSGNRRVQRFDAGFNFVAEYAVPGWLYVDSVAKPYIALLPDGGLIVSDPTQNKLFRLDAQGKPIATLDAEGTALAIPRGVAFDSRGFLYVAEAEPDQVRRLQLSVPAPP